MVQRIIGQEVNIEEIALADLQEEITDVINEHVTHISKDGTMDDGTLPGDIVETEGYSTLQDSTTDAYEEATVLLPSCQELAVSTSEEVSCKPEEEDVAPSQPVSGTETESSPPVDQPEEEDVSPSQLVSGPETESSPPVDQPEEDVSPSQLVSGPETESSLPVDQPEKEDVSPSQLVSGPETESSPPVDQPEEDVSPSQLVSGPETESSLPVDQPEKEDVSPSQLVSGPRTESAPPVDQPEEEAVSASQLVSGPEAELFPPVDQPAVIDKLPPQSPQKLVKKYEVPVHMSHQFSVIRTCYK